MEASGARVQVAPDARHTDWAIIADDPKLRASALCGLLSPLVIECLVVVVLNHEDFQNH